MRYPLLVRRALPLAALVLVACEPGQIAPEELAGIFVRRSVCSELALTSTIASIVGGSDGSAAAASSQLDCSRSASSCDALDRCSGIDPDTSCDPSDDAPRCDGDVAEQCHSSGRIQRTDCASDDEGNTGCFEDELGVPRCGIGSCAEDGIRCEGDVIVSCSLGVERRAEDCAVSGRACVVFAAMRAGCVDRVESCDDDVCDGDLRLRCIAGMGYQETDCAATIAPATCVDEDGPPRCGLEEPECEDGAGECVGAVARICDGGRWIELDCASFDAACVDESADGETQLRCE